jgi:hypothetical protein
MENSNRRGAQGVGLVGRRACSVIGASSRAVVRRTSQNERMRTPEERERILLLRRLEKLARQVSDSRFVRPESGDIISFQESIFDLQRDIQVAISDVKKRLGRKEGIREHLDLLRQIRWFSLRLGDAVAWSLLIYNRQVIYSLHSPHRVPIATSTTDGTRGVFMMARSLAGQEWGIPIIHDMTSILRVGDLTFMRPALLPDEPIYKTFELKTSRAAEVANDDGSTTVTFNILVISNEEFPAMPGAIGPRPESTVAPTMPKRREDRRLSSQLRRMDRALTKRTAPMDDIVRATDEGESAGINLSLDQETEPHWAQLRRAIREARSGGYAYFSLDGFVGYAVFYSATGVDHEVMQRGSLNDDILSTIVSEETGKRDSITVSTVPDDEKDPFSNFVLPVFLWKVPQRAIVDIIRGRLVIAAVYNSGRIEQLLEAQGFRTKPDGEDPRSFYYEVPVEWPTGETAVLEVHAPWKDMFTAVHEFRGPKNVIERALAIQQLPQKIAFEKFRLNAMPDDITSRLT